MANEWQNETLGDWERQGGEDGPGCNGMTE